MAIGLEPLEELVGVRMQSLNYINTEYAKEYQLKDIKMEGENGE